MALSRDHVDERLAKRFIEDGIVQAALGFALFAANRHSRKDGVRRRFTQLLRALARRESEGQDINLRVFFRVFDLDLSHRCLGGIERYGNDFSKRRSLYVAGFAAEPSLILNERYK